MEVVFNAVLQDVDVDADAKLQSITVVDATTSTETLYSAEVFIDASYEGDLMAAAGVSFVTGREGQSEYNESLAGFVSCDVLWASSAHRL